VVIQHEERVYKSVDEGELKVDIYYANSAVQKKKPAIIFFHGGGWVFGDRSEFSETCKRYAAKGFVTFSFQYRLSINEDGSYPHPSITPVESVKDARSAVRWVRAHADSLKIDPNRIIVSGQSAGGQLALCTELADSINELTDDLMISPSPDALVLYSSNVNTMEAWIDMLLGDRRDEIWSISPYHLARKSMPPVIDFHGEEDCMVLPYTVSIFRQRMNQLGNHYELINYPGRQHYLGEGNEKYARYFDEEILERTDDFLERFGLMGQGQ
jgi:acetyl esterase/lipase